MKGLPLFGLALALGALGLALTSSAPAGPATVLALAALCAFDALAAPALAVLAAGIAFGQPPADALTATSAIGVAAAGIGLGLVVRSLGRIEGWLLGPGALGTAVLLVVAVGLCAWLPAEHVTLATADGDPLLVWTTFQDGPTQRRFTEAIPLIVAHRPALAGILDLLPWAAGAAVFVLLWAGADPEPRVQRAAWLVTGVVAAALVVVGFAGLAELTGAEIPLSDTDLIRADLARLGQGAVVAIELPSSGYLAPVSRPGVDALRTVLGAVLLLLAVVRLRRPIRGAEAAVPPRGALPELPLALAAAAVALPFVPTGTALAMLAAMVLVAAALLVGVLGRPGDRAPLDLLGAATLTGVAAWLGPLIGWLA